MLSDEQDPDVTGHVYATAHINEQYAEHLVICIEHLQLCLSCVCVCVCVCIVCMNVQHMRV